MMMMMMMMMKLPSMYRGCWLYVFRQKALIDSLLKGYTPWDPPLLGKWHYDCMLHSTWSVSGQVVT